MTGPRDRVIDLIRAGSLTVVVIGHWTMATVIVRADGTVGGANALAAMPWLHPVTWALQVIPLFFVAGGFANARVWEDVRRRGGGYAGYVRRRMHRLVRPAVMFGVVTITGLVVARLAGVPVALLETIAAVLIQPLWFLAVYVIVTALAPVAMAAHRRRPIGTLAALAGGALTVDLVTAAGETAAGVANFVVVWSFAHQVGLWYADGSLLRLGRRTLLAVAAAAATALALLTGPGPYPVSMVGLPGQMSNMNPPTVCLVVLAVGQTALVLRARPRLEAWSTRRRVQAVVNVMGRAGMTVYLWHLVVLLAVAGAGLAIGAPFPEPGTAAWWLTRPVWLAALAVTLAAGVAVAATLRRSVGRTGVDVGPRRRVS